MIGMDLLGRFGERRHLDFRLSALGQGITALASLLTICKSLLARFGSETKATPPSPISRRRPWTTIRNKPAPSA